MEVHMYGDCMKEVVSGFWYILLRAEGIIK